MNQIIKSNAPNSVTKINKPLKNHNFIRKLHSNYLIIESIYQNKKKVESDKFPPKEKTYRI